jgi:RNA polymerase sigma-70 factor, ECF subfamily
MFFTLPLKLRLISTIPLQILIDKEIIEECRKGNLHYFRKLIEISSPFAFAVAFRMLGDESQATDIAQESMITIWKTIKKIRSADSFKTWLYRIVVNKCLDQLRKRKNNPEFNADEKTWTLISNKISEEPFIEMENKEIALIINLLTEKLSPKQKAVFVLSDLEEMSNEEISAITGMNRANIKANLHYARKRIGEMINKHL